MKDRGIPWENLVPILLCEKVQVVKHNKRNHRVWGDSNVVRAETTVKSQPSFISHDFSGTIEYALIWQLSRLWILLLFLQTCLDEVKGQGKETGKKAGNG